MANHDLSNVTTSALKRELERRGWTVHLENGPPSKGPSVFERLGDNVHHLLPFLEVPSLCRLDAAMTSRKGRETAWLPRLAGLESADLVLKEVGRLYKVDDYQPSTFPVNAAAWLNALRWLVVRGVPLPKSIHCPRDCNASQFTACLSHCTTAGSVWHIDLQNCSGTLTAADMLNLQRCTGLTSMFTSKGLLEDQGIWEQLDAQNWTCFTTLKEFRSYFPISIVTAEIWGRRLSALVSIEVEYRNNGSLEHLCKIKTLQDISVHCLYYAELGTAVEYAAFVHLNKLPALRSLCIYSCNFIDAALGHIQDFPSLRELRVCSCNFSAAGIALIAEHFGLLEKLSLFTTVTDADLAVLSRLTSLQKLSLGGYIDQRNITDAGVAYLRDLTCLQDLDLRHTDITSQSLSVIGSLTQLRELHLSYCPGLFDNDYALAHLRSLTNLTWLDVRYSGLTDAGLDSLHSAANLETLILGDGAGVVWLITAVALKRLVAACRKLKKLLFDGFKHAKSIGLISRTFQTALVGRGIDVKDCYHNLVTTAAEEAV